MFVFHIVPGTGDVSNGMVVVARMLAKEQGEAEVVDLKRGIHGNIVFDMTGRSGVSPLQGKGGFDFFKKRRDAASPSHGDMEVRYVSILHVSDERLDFSLAENLFDGEADGLDLLEAH